MFSSVSTSAAGVIVYGGNATDGTDNPFDFDWCFYLGTYSNKLITNIFVSKIILHNHIFYHGGLSYIGFFPVYIGMPLIFTNLQ